MKRFEIKRRGAGAPLVERRTSYAYITGSILLPQPPAKGRGGKAKSPSSRQEASAATFVATMGVAVGAGCGRNERNHPAASQERGIENSDQPQSRHTMTSGEGVMGGWLRVRWQLR